MQHNNAPPPKRLKSEPLDTALTSTPLHTTTPVEPSIVDTYRIFKDHEKDSYFRHDPVDVSPGLFALFRQRVTRGLHLAEHSPLPAGKTLTVLSAEDMRAGILKFHSKSATLSDVEKISKSPFVKLVREFDRGNFDRIPRSVSTKLVNCGQQIPILTLATIYHYLFKTTEELLDYLQQHVPEIDDGPMLLCEMIFEMRDDPSSDAQKVVTVAHYYLDCGGGGISGTAAASNDDESADTRQSNRNMLLEAVYFLYESYRVARIDMHRLITDYLNERDVVAMVESGHPGDMVLEIWAHLPRSPGFLSHLCTRIHNRYFDRFLREALACRIVHPLDVEEWSHTHYVKEEDSIRVRRLVQEFRDGCRDFLHHDYYTGPRSNRYKASGRKQVMLETGDEVSGYVVPVFNVALPRWITNCHLYSRTKLTFAVESTHYLLTTEDLPPAKPGAPVIVLRKCVKQDGAPTTTTTQQ